MEIVCTRIFPDGESDSLVFIGCIAWDQHESILLLGIGWRLFLCGRMYVDDLGRPLLPLNYDRADNRSRVINTIGSFA